MSWITLELPDCKNITGKSCILPGTYDATVIYSPHFKKRLYRLDDKNGRTAVEIHAANLAGDVDLGWKSELHGCIALGKAIGKLDIGASRMQRAILQSSKAIAEFMAATSEADLELEIR